MTTRMQRLYIVIKLLIAHTYAVEIPSTSSFFTDETASVDTSSSQLSTSSVEVTPLAQSTVTDLSEPTGFPADADKPVALNSPSAMDIVQTPDNVTQNPAGSVAVLDEKKSSSSGSTMDPPEIQSTEVVKVPSNPSIAEQVLPKGSFYTTSVRMTNEVDIIQSHEGPGIHSINLEYLSSTNNLHKNKRQFSRQNSANGDEQSRNAGQQSQSSQDDGRASRYLC